MAACFLSMSFFLYLRMALDDFLYQINGNIHIIAGFLGSDGIAFDWDSHLNFCRSFFALSARLLRCPE